MRPLLIPLLLSAALTTAAAPASPYRGTYHTVTPQGDTILNVLLHELVVYPAPKFKNKKEEEYYWRTVRDVKLTLPWAKLICETLIETYEYLETFPTTEEREAHIKAMESQLFARYKPDLKKLSRRQARVLVKLIQRETDQSGYAILKAFLGSFRATFWQGFGRIFGVNLNASYNPATDPDDATLDRIATLVEQSAL